MISEGDEVIVQKDANLNLFTVKAKKFMWMDKMKFTFDGILNEPYGTRFILENNCLKKASPDDVRKLTDLEEVSGDNRNLRDDGSSNQKLSSDDIDSMRREGVTGEDIMKTIVANSETFESKTEFSKEKYIKKKKKKHVPIVTVLKPTIRLMFEYHLRRNKNKLCWIREDTFAQILCQGDVRSGGNYLVVETLEGLLVGAILDRLKGCGKIVEIYNGTQPNRLSGLGWNRQYYNDHVFSVSINKTEDLLTAVLGTRTRLSLNMAPPQSAVDDGGENGGTGTANQDQISVTSSVLAQPAVRYTAFSHPAESDTKPKFRCTPCDPGCYSKRMKQDADEPPECSHTHQKPETTMTAEPTLTTNIDDVDGAKRKVEDGDASGSAGGGTEETSWKRQRFEFAKDFLNDHKMDGLFIATKMYPLPLVLELLPLVAPSRQVVIYCPHQEPLMMCYKAFRDNGGLVNVKMTETWSRDYQVLPNRTHPVINMNGSSGYLLTATTVDKE